MVIDAGQHRGMGFARLGRAVSPRGRIGERPNVLAGLFGLVWLIIVIAPIWYMILASLRSQSAYEAQNPWVPQGGLTFSNYGAVFAMGLATYVRNSVIVTVASVAITISLALFAAYAITRGRTVFTKMVLRFFLLGLAVPGTAILIPLFYFMTTIHLFDNLVAVILPTAAFALPVSTLIMTNFIRDVPRELFEAMVLDGAHERDLLFRLVIPLSRSPLMAIGVFSALGAWNGFVFPLILTNSRQYQVLPMAVYTFQGIYTSNPPAILATVIISALPLVALYIVGRRYIVRGMAAGYSR